jgi:hypothetical protein
LESWLATENLEGESLATALDTAICYLRRVHLYHFYTCTKYTKLADCITQPVHVRARTGHYDPDDLLVQQLVEKQEQALLDCVNWGTSVDEEAAAAIESAEHAAQTAWLSTNSIHDDGRARCAFSYCRKLFKDNSYLEKHLLKKHGENLAAELAKAHDAAMMKAWEDCEDRPVPDILVDAGNLRLLPTNVKGKVPDCVDPEPAAWQERERMKQERQQEKEQRTVRSEAETIRAIPASFVDVDDMKEEKVQVSFENVPMPKKKKRKRLL